MRDGRWRLWFGVLYLLVLSVGLALGLRVMVEGYSPVPFADFWGQFAFIERGVNGDVSIGDLWAQWNEHRIVVARIQFLLDYRFFDGTNVFLFAAIAASCLALAGAFATAVWVDTRDLLLALGTLSVAVVSTMSPAGIENLTWAFQVQFVQVFFFATVAVLAIVVAAWTEPRSREIVLAAAAAFAAIAATYSMANGFLVWLVVVGLAVLLRLDRRLTVGLAIVGLATVCSFFWHLEFDSRGTLSDPVGLLTFVAIYLGSAVWGAGSRQAVVVGGVGLALFPVLCVLAWKRRSTRLVALPFGAGVATFVLLTATQTAVGRLHLGTSHALSSRYSIGSFTFWLALVVGFLPLLRERLPARPLAAPFYLGCAAVASLFVGYRTLPAGTYLPTVTMGKEMAVVANRVGVEDASGLVTGEEGGRIVARSFRWMEQHELGPWAPGGMVDGMRVTEPTSMTTRACLGAIGSNEPVTGGRRLRGWIAAPDGEATSRSLIVLDRNGTPRGLGLVGTYRPNVRDLGAARSDWTGFVSYVHDEPPRPLAVMLLAPDRKTAVCRLLTARS